MGCPCKSCEKVNFKVFDDKGTQITTISKRGKDCIKNALSDADNFGIDFTPNMTWEERTLLLAAALLIDYMMFENNSSKQDGPSGDW